MHRIGGAIVTGRERLPKEVAQALVWEPRKFFRAARAGHFLIQHCDACDSPLGPGAWVCDVCWGDKLSWVESEGRGSIYAEATVHLAYMPALAKAVPYQIAIVELDEGLRLPGRIIVERSSDHVCIGDRVRVCFGTSGTRVVPLFRPDPTHATR